MWSDWSFALKKVPYYKLKVTTYFWCIWVAEISLKKSVDLVNCKAEKGKKGTEKSTCSHRKKEGHLFTSQVPIRHLVWPIGYSHATTRRAQSPWWMGSHGVAVLPDASDHLLKTLYAPVYTRTTHSIAAVTLFPFSIYPSPKNPLLFGI